jgi:hypothetical protein
MGIQSFTIDIPQATLDDLHARLARTHWPDEVEGAGWDYGTNLTYLKELMAYWQHDFDWRKQEAKLNGFAQFRAQIDGVGIHFVHVRGKGPTRYRYSSFTAGPICSIAITKSLSGSPTRRTLAQTQLTPLMSLCPLFRDLASLTIPEFAVGGQRKRMNCGRS